MERLDAVATLFMIFWITVIFQGAIRKWLLPGFQILYFIQDVPIFIAYVYAIANGIIWYGGVFYFSIFFAFILFLQSALQVIFINYDMAAALIGLHHYLFYLPMIFLIPACMTHRNIQKFIRFNLLTILPMSMLAFMQVISPRNAWVNQTAAGDDVGQAFSVDGVLARSSGTFNFTLPFSVWCGIMVALVIGEWLTPPERRAFRSRAFLILNSVAMLITSATSGSRTAVFLVLLAVVGGFFAVLIRSNLTAIAGYASMLLILPLLVGLAYFLAPANLNTLANRFTEKSDQQEMTFRVQNMTVGFITDTQFSLLGKGIAANIPAAQAAANAFNSDPYRGADNFEYAEWDNIRAVQGLGTFVGTIVVLSRYVTSIIVLFAAYKAYALPGIASFTHAMPLAFTVVPTLAIGDMIHSAPVQAPQVLYCAAMICSALLYRREASASVPMPLTESTARV